MKLTKSLYKSRPDFLAKREKNRGTGRGGELPGAAKICYTV
ncbi:hypothetical protein HMPREF0262_01265 [Clostridium sp. ATCC 29733]|nr:hypothetical protein HMPREF0262_01265 [Clostridium sp. ATCC 29733]